MREYELDGANARCLIYVGEGALGRCADISPSERRIVVTDTNVKGLYGELIDSMFPDAGVFEIAPGEDSKNFLTLYDLLVFMTDRKLTRGSWVIAFGGGVVGDLAGLAASLFMRGVRLAQIPTTLLSQVDSSVGGKTAVNFDGYKNLLGTFYQPELVLSDPVFLGTLPEREMRCGMGEIVKYAALCPKIFDELSAAPDPYDRGFLRGVICDCVEYKAGLCSGDERDTEGRRRALNAGHTVGHALEAKYGGLSHGEYVAVGMFYEMNMAAYPGKAESPYQRELTSLIKKVVPRIPYFKNVRCAAGESALDKKNGSADHVTFVAPWERGSVREVTLSLDEYTERLKDANAYARRIPLRLALVGGDVSRSDSPRMHAFICSALGVKAEYDLYSLDEEAFEREIDGIIAGHDGVNVTMPYKVSVTGHLSSLSQDAETLGSVNAVSCPMRRGHNTDWYGFERLLELNDLDVSGEKVLVLGLGGAGTTVAHVLSDEGAKVFLYDKAGEKAREAARSIPGATALDAAVPGDYYMILNATGVGMNDTEGESPVGEDVIEGCSVAVDLIHRPEESEFLRIAGRLGKDTVNGQDMLFFQAYLSDCLFAGVEPDNLQALFLNMDYDSGKRRTGCGKARKKGKRKKGV